MLYCFLFLLRWKRRFETRNGISGVVGKLDIEKAFDHVNSDFYVLELMGFGEQRRRWIKFGTSQVCVLYLVYLGDKQEVPIPMEEVQG